MTQLTGFPGEGGGEQRGPRSPLRRRTSDDPSPPVVLGVRGLGVRRGVGPVASSKV